MRWQQRTRPRDHEPRGPPGRNLSAGARAVTVLLQRAVRSDTPPCPLEPAFAIVFISTSGTRKIDFRERLRPTLLFFFQDMRVSATAGYHEDVPWNRLPAVVVAEFHDPYFLIDNVLPRHVRLELKKPILL